MHTLLHMAASAAPGNACNSCLLGCSELAGYVQLQCIQFNIFGGAGRQ